MTDWGNWTVERILARCTEEGDCLIWPGAMAQSVPIIYTNGARATRRSARRALWEMTRGTIPKNRFASCSCGEVRCLALPHLVLMTKHQIGKRLAATGALSSPVRKAKLAAVKQAASPLTWDDVKRIREAGNGLAIAKELGVSQMTVWRIRHMKTWKPRQGFSVFSQG